MKSIILKVSLEVYGKEGYVGNEDIKKIIEDALFNKFSVEHEIGLIEDYTFNVEVYHDETSEIPY